MFIIPSHTILNLKTNKKMLQLIIYPKNKIII